MFIELFGYSFFLSLPVTIYNLTIMRKILLLIALFGAFALNLRAIPALRDSVKIAQPDGTTVTVLIRGDEHAHLYVSTDGYPLAYDEAGYLRYARVEADSRLTTEGAPVARDVNRRTAAERRFLAALPKADFPAFYATRRAAKRAASATRSADNPIQIGNFPTEGEIRGLVILAQFPDRSFSFDHDFHSRMMNESGFSDEGGTGSARDYFIDQSGGIFQPQFDVVGPVTLSRSYTYYGSNDYFGSDAHAGEMIAEACQLAQSEQGCDFSNYDFDSDGFVDMVFVIFAGYGEHDGGGVNTVWPHKSNLRYYGIDLSLNGKQIDVYACSSELSYLGEQDSEDGNPVTSGIGPFCHEFSHVIGLADHYQTNGGSQFMLGSYDLMDYGPYNNNGLTPAAYTAFERYSLGWLELEELNQPADGVELGTLTDTRRAYRISTSDPNEFFTLENRQQTGWDAFLASSGLMISHIHYEASAWEGNTVNNNSNHPRVMLIPADNTRSSNSEVTDLYPNVMGNDAFTDESLPAATTWNGEVLNRWVTDIRNENGVVTFDFMANVLDAPAVLPALNVTNTGFTAQWEAVADAQGYMVNLYRMLTIDEVPLALSEDFALMTDGQPDRADSRNISGQLDDYMGQPGWTGSYVFQAGGWCRIGSPVLSGHLVTPAVNVTPHEGTFTVVVVARAESGRTPDFTVSANGLAGTCQLSDQAATYVFRFSGGTAATSVRLGVTRERAYLDQVEIVRGDATGQYPGAVVVETAAEAGLPQARAAETVADDPYADYVREKVQTVENISETSYTFDGLVQGALYCYTVQTVGDVSNSEESAEMVVQLSGGTGISGTTAADGLQYSCDGRVLTVRGCAAGDPVSVYGIDGTLLHRLTANAAEVEIQLPGSGIYVLHTPAGTAKVVCD